MREDKRIIFPSDRDIIEEREIDEFRDRLLSKCTDMSNGIKVVLLNFGSAHTAKFRLEKGMINGLVRCTTEDGTLLSVTQYVNNIKHGLYMKYDMNGWVSCVGTYRNGLCDGVWKYYDENGDTIKTVKY